MISRRRVVTVCIVAILAADLTIGGCIYGIEIQGRPRKMIARDGPAKDLIYLPSQCRALYNVGRHNDWSDCMGVSYVKNSD